VIDRDHGLRGAGLLSDPMDRLTGLTVLVALSLGLAGCSAAIPGETSTGTTSPGETEREGTEFEVSVREVIDGDTVAVAFPDGTVENVRLLGVDAPETRADTQPDEFEGVPDTEAGRTHLRTWGERATAFAESRLAVGETVRIVVDETADRRGSYERLLVYLYDDGDLFNLLLLEEGYARLFDTTFEKRSAFASAETEAMQRDVGVWGFEESTATGYRSRPDRRADQIPNVARSMSRVPGPSPTAMMAIRRMIA
jgi:micrococcal nuclease